MGRRPTQGRLLHSARAYPAATLSAVLLALVILMALGAPLLAPYDPTAQRPAERLAGPSAGHWLGTDELGRDILSRIVVGSRTTLLAAGLSVVLAFAIGVLLGVVAGYFGGPVETIIMRAMDVMLSFPLVLLALLIVAALGPGLPNLILAVGISQIPLFARLSRSQVLTLRTREFVEAARCLGASHPRILAAHITPNILGPLGVQATTTMALAIVATSSLSFLGFGIQPPTPDWGVMINETRRFILDRPDLLFYPALAIVIVVISLNVLGDSLSVVLDPAARRQVG